MSLVSARVRAVPTAQLMDLLRSPVLWCLAVVVFSATRFLAGDISQFLDTLDDTDNATRLVQVRMLLEGTSWFDLRLPQFGLDKPLLSHWSRLVDAPIAGLILLYRPLLGQEGAETAARLVWPSLVLFAMTYLVVREVVRQAGPLAGLLAAGLILTGPYALFQFVPGRIDHHNVQILGVAGGLILLPRALRAPQIGLFTGALIGVGLAVGYEALVLAAGVVALAGLFACFFKEMRAGFVQVLAGLALGVGLSFFATTAPSQWFNAACDALGLNLVALTAAGAGAAWLLHRFVPQAPAWIWIAGMAAGGGVGVAAFGAIEPSCLAGPLANIDPRVKPIWLDHILEAKSLWQFTAQDPKVGIAYFLTVGIVAAILGHAWWRDRTSHNAFALAAFVAASAYGCIYVRLMPYAIWIALPPLAAWMAQLPAVGTTPARSIRLGALVTLNQTTILVVAQTLASALTGHTANAEALRAGIADCESRADLRAVGRLPKGLILSDIDLGPHIAAHGPHRVMAAPYHRLDQEIIAVDGILKSKPAAAEASLRRAGVTYVVLCASGLERIRKEGSRNFQDVLRLGERVSFLEPIKVGDGTGKLKAWRLKAPGATK